MDRLRRGETNIRQSRLRLEPLEDRTLLSTFTVNRFGDLGKGRGLQGDLRYCITQANALPGQDLIIFGQEGTIHLKSALPNISDDLLIFGSGADQVTVRRHIGGNYRVFTINSGVQAEIHSLTISNGFAPSTTWGGGIHNSGNLLLDSVAVVGNRADCGSCSNARGGGILNSGSLTIFDSLVAQNVVHGSGSFGGGIDNRPGATLFISNSTITENRAEDDGSYDNTVHGGGINNSSGATLTLMNTTIARNMNVKTGSSGNSSGGAIKGDVQLMRNTIVALNTAQSGADISGSVASTVHSIIGGDPKLGALQHNGGPTMTIALLPDSPAINTGGNFNNPEFDQRGLGFVRVVSDVVDIGAFEVQVGPAPDAPHGRPDVLVLSTAQTSDVSAPIAQPTVTPAASVPDMHLAAVAALNGTVADSEVIPATAFTAFRPASDAMFAAELAQKLLLDLKAFG